MRYLNNIQIYIYICTYTCTYLISHESLRLTVAESCAPNNYKLLWPKSINHESRCMDPLENQGISRRRNLVVSSCPRTKQGCNQSGQNIIFHQPRYSCSSTFATPSLGEKADLDFPEIAGVPFPLLFTTLWGPKTRVFFSVAR